MLNPFVPIQEKYTPLGHHAICKCPSCSVNSLRSRRSVSFSIAFSSSHIRYRFNLASNILLMTLQ